MISSSSERDGLKPRASSSRSIIRSRLLRSALLLVSPDSSQKPNIAHQSSPLSLQARLHIVWRAAPNSPVGVS
eukprot:12122590-Alexandrium_andersonii.AAC.1